MGGFFTAEVVSIPLPSVWRFLWLLCGWGVGGEGWPWEVLEVVYAAQMSQAEGGVDTSGGGTRTSPGRACLWAWGALGPSQPIAGLEVCGGS